MSLNFLASFPIIPVRFPLARGLRTAIFLVLAATARGGTPVNGVPGADPAPVATNLPLPTSDQVASMMEQRRQMLAELAAQLATAAPPQQQTLIATFRQQMDSLTAGYVPAPLSPALKDQLTIQTQADQQAQAATLSAVDQQIVNVMLQRQQLALQLGVASLEQQPALVAQLRQLTDQQNQAVQSKQAAQSALIPATPTTLAEMAAARVQAVAEVMASLPPDKQAALLAAEQYRQAVFAALQLPPDQQPAAFNAVLNPPETATATPAPPPLASPPESAIPTASSEAASIPDATSTAINENQATPAAAPIPSTP